MRPATNTQAYFGATRRFCKIATDSKSQIEPEMFPVFRAAWFLLKLALDNHILRILQWNSML